MAKLNGPVGIGLPSPRRWLQLLKTLYRFLVIRFSGRGFVAANIRAAESSSTMIRGQVCGDGAHPIAVAIASARMLIGRGKDRKPM